MIEVLEKEKTFILSGNGFSYVIKIIRGRPAHLHFGKRVKAEEGVFGEKFYPVSFVCPEDDDFTNLESMRCEYPVFGYGDTKTDAARFVKDEKCVFDFKYCGYKITNDKRRGVYPEPFGGETLVLSLSDEVTKTELSLYYTVYEDCNVLVRKAEVTNLGDTPLIIKKLNSFSVDCKDFGKVLSLKGRYAAENRICEQEIKNGAFVLESREGLSSHKTSPFVALSNDFRTDFGDVVACSLLYGGNFKIEAAKTAFGFVRFTGGFNDLFTDIKVLPSESFCSPSAAVTYSDCGLNGIGKNYHGFIRDYMLRKTEGYSPVVLNGWETLGFDYDREKIFSMIEKCKGTGVNTFVMDDGWFGHRTDDKGGLGDWFVNEKKLPGGLKPVIDKCKECGLKFGLWIEPECVSEDSELFKNHPDWVIGGAGRTRLKSRNQYVLDLTKKEVKEYLKRTFAEILENNDISYVKWDMNRFITEPSFANGFYLRYAEGFYELAGYLTERFKNVFFECCSAGGGRTDAGMTAYFDRLWISDMTDVAERIKTLSGVTLFLPLEYISNHLSDVPNIQNGRVTDRESRFAANTMGKFGYEFNVINADEAEMKAETEKYLCAEKTFGGTFYRLTENDGDYSAFCSVSEDRREFALWVYYGLADYAKTPLGIKLKGLNENYVYTCKDLNVKANGVNLQNYGLTILPEYKDNKCRMFIFNATDD